MNTRLFGSVALCVPLVIGQIARAQPAATPSNTSQVVTVPFSDAGRPGTVKIDAMSASVSVKVGAGRDVVVTTTAGRDRDDGRDRNRTRRNSGSTTDSSTAGLRRLTQPPGVKIEQENNVISISATTMTNPVNVGIEVPATTSLVLRVVIAGDVSVDGVNGSIEVNNINGSIHLTSVGGAVIAHSTNGDVVAALRQVVAGTPMSFTSLNGNVDVTLPGSTKANLKMRSDQGDVFTDFDVRTTASPARATPGDARVDGRPGPVPSPRPSPNSRGRNDPKDKAKYRLEMDRSIYGTVNGGGADFELRTFNGNVYLRKAK